MATTSDSDFPCSLTVYVPFPSHRLAKAAAQTLSVDPELSKLVTRSFSLVKSLPDSATAVQGDTFKASLVVNAAPTQPIQEPSTSGPVGSLENGQKEVEAEMEPTILKTEYSATTNRMLRVAVNGFFDSLGTVIQVMEELDTDVIHEKGLESLEGAQGVEQGMTGTAG
ncbi:hypothetical protein M409DRAFT_17688 [Zasmidium cellare ATCC 36951]|uniref:Pcc1-domain-containing protein n=1 Tax=Zasmidium cellare ATCC 36951 TaxID=1080233 RepID=A0A6A6D470_ZASCE|nr:uncharacterized protein M409DRAFT_17688 [Zasmidium cellare ATCC 36951]KAF2172456.1 hypothetical protein M409DRAFT_17688 [Zasmidium cellare ATCC 36951]